MNSFSRARYNPAFAKSSISNSVQTNQSSEKQSKLLPQQQNEPATNNVNPCSRLDKVILLKKGIQRQHIHCYDLCLVIKTLKKDEEEEVRIQKMLQRFLDTMLRADPSTLIPPYLELDRSDKNIPDLGKEKPVSELKDYSDL